MDILRDKLSKENFYKLMKINNIRLHEFIAESAELCNPDRVFICTDSPEDIEYIRQEAIKTGEEKRVVIEGHTVHFDGYYDQARDKEKTKFLVKKGVELGKNINAIDKEEGMKEVYQIMKDIMKGHTMYVRFLCLGPANSEFTIPAVQLTDSSYVAHSESLLYRSGYEELKRLGQKGFFFKALHSEGELDERLVSKNVDKRRIYIDNEHAVIYSMNTQYGGNTLGLKKLAMRLAIYRASQEGWLTEHMFVVGVHGPKGRITYFTGAFPSLCGKTSTAMLPGETIVGDDIAYLRKSEGRVRAVNVEKGIFGIIMGINHKDDPLIWKVLNSPGEVIFSNVLIYGGDKVWWIRKDKKMPDRGINHAGEWTRGMKDKEGNEITPSHKNARFTIELKILDNVDSKLDDPRGVPVDGIIYGGRDSDTWVPVEKAFDWAHGIVTKAASLESETTAATLGKEGVRKFNPMANLDFLSIPIGRYIEDNLNFGANLKEPPSIFSVNYFLRDEKGNFLNEVDDKTVWLKWMELCVHGEIEAIKTPTGFMPRYKDLKRLFKNVLGKEYTEESYIKQFTIRVRENLEKIERILRIYRSDIKDTPDIVFKILEEQRERLTKARESKGDYISPESLSG